MESDIRIQADCAERPDRFRFASKPDVPGARSSKLFTKWAQTPFEGKQVRVMKPNKAIIAAGIFAMAIGALPLLTALGILPHGHNASDPAPSWMAWLIGLMFGGAGISIVMRGILGGDANGYLPLTAPRWLRAAHELIGVFIIFSFAILFSWIAFGPGTRHFSVSSGGASMPTSGETMGRVAFGIGAILTWCFAAYAVVVSWRRLRG
jgi:hypothetical protein